MSLIGRWSELDRDASPARRTRPAASMRPRTPLAGRSLEVEIEDAARQPPRRADVRRSGTPLHRRQRRRLRHRRQRQVREPPALRDLARQGRLVGDRQRIDQRHSRRVGERRARPQRTATPDVAGAQTRDRSRARRAHRALRRSPVASRRIPAASAAHRRRSRRPRHRMAPRVHGAARRPRRRSSPCARRQADSMLTVRMADGRARRADPGRAAAISRSGARATSRW